MDVFFGYQANDPDNLHVYSRIYIADSYSIFRAFRVQSKVQIQSFTMPSHICRHWFECPPALTSSFLLLSNFNFSPCAFISSLVGQIVMPVIPYAPRPTIFSKPRQKFPLFFSQKTHRHSIPSPSGSFCLPLPDFQDLGF